MRIYYSVALGVLLSVVANTPARADTDLTGTWTGPFSGVQVEIPLQPGPFGYVSGESRGVQQEPRFVETKLQINFETQKKGLAVGTWNAGTFKQKFVCAQPTRRAGCRLCAFAESQMSHTGNRVIRARIFRLGLHQRPSRQGHHPNGTRLSATT